MFLPRFRAGAAFVLLGGLLTAACGSEDTATEAAAQSGPASDIRFGPNAFRNTSVTPALIKGLPADVKAYSIISSDDDLAASPGFVFGGSADGAGFLTNGDGTYTIVVNHEDNFAVSRVTLDETFAPVKGEYLLNSTFGLFRLCSATLATPEVHGFGPVFITAGESGPESQIHAVDPYGAPNTSRLLPALGQWSTENAVPLPKEAYRGRTVIVIGDDDSGPEGGQVALYVGKGIGDLDNGDLFVMAPAGGPLKEREMVVGQKYPVQFRKVEDQRTLRDGGLNEAAAALGAFAFGRVEDIDYRKALVDADGSAAREIYFLVTGQNNSGANADYSRTKYGRMYRLVLDRRDPTKGTLEVLLDGDDRTGPAGAFQNPDNIVVTENYAYVQEDPNGYRDETHDAYIYQYDIKRRTLGVFAELDHRRTAEDAAKYGGNSRFGSWEYGAMIDVTQDVARGRGRGLSFKGRGVFLLAIQPHTWRGERYRGVDGGTLRPNENQASQLVFLTGVPR